MRTTTTRFRIAMLAAPLTVVALAAQAPPAQVSSQELLDGLKPDGSRWLTFGGNYANHRFSPLTQITPRNVDGLRPQWLFQTEVAAPGRGFETTPLVAAGVTYITGNQNTAWAVDARTGSRIWSYRRKLPDL